MIDVNIHHDELQSTPNFLRDMQDMLHIARDKIKTTQDRARVSVVKHQQTRVFLLMCLMTLQHYVRVSVLVHQPIASCLPR